ncbi:hypothetical protein RHSIM_Rhsim12G0019100 [Rhododendron simsii]|uniref:Jacalin-type lectin domain-containing protein n=1 Tax=Rhododendron simsii TaxID=118357 RepID=A0A834L8N2_RHOSS|nr:hypothetical protein RHSIM_Rhsim12G0019100 [Rhododendron simsii]
MLTSILGVDLNKLFIFVLFSVTSSFYGGAAAGYERLWITTVGDAKVRLRAKDWVNVCLIYVVLMVVNLIHQPMVDGVVQRIVDALCGFLSRELMGRLWRLIAGQKKPQAASVLLDQGQAIVHVYVQGNISDGKGCISSGLGGGKEGAYWIYKADGPVMLISVRYGDAIDSIIFQSKNNDGVGRSVKIGGIGGHTSKTVRHFLAYS